MGGISLIIADDQLLFVDLLKNIIKSRAPDFNILGTASNGNEAIELVYEKKPTIALLDVRMPGLDGVKVTKKICSELPDIKVVILTTFPDDEYVKKAMQYGASGYLLKNIPIDELIASLRSVARGNFIISQHVAKRFISNTLSSAKEIKGDVKLTENQKKLAKSLSRREKEIYELMVNGYSNHEIAEMLYIAKQTVKNHIHSIYSKFGLNTRSDIYNLK